VEGGEGGVMAFPFSEKGKGTEAGLSTSGSRKEKGGEGKRGSSQFAFRL